MIGFRSQIQENDWFLLPNKNGFHCQLKKLGYCCQMKNNWLLLPKEIKKYLVLMPNESFDNYCFMNDKKLKAV